MRGYGRAPYLHATFTHLRQEQTTLIETMWQPGKFPEE